MTRFVVLINFSEKGIADVADSISRADAFQAAAEKAGAKVESVYWTLGCYDGLFVLSAPDEATAAALVLGIGKGSSVRTTMLRAFDRNEFADVIAKLNG